jgi:hypothetical protein
MCSHVRTASALILLDGQTNYSVPKRSAAQCRSTAVWGAEKYTGRTSLWAQCCQSVHVPGAPKCEIKERASVQKISRDLVKVGSMRGDEIEALVGPITPDFEREGPDITGGQKTGSN